MEKISQPQDHSFSKTLLCRRECDSCSRIIRFFGVRCKDCRYKCHKRCSEVAKHSCGGLEQKIEKKCVKRKSKKIHGGGRYLMEKRTQDTIVKDDYHFQIKRTTRLQKRHNRGNQNKIGRKLVSGIYESFCYSLRTRPELYYPRVENRVETACQTSPEDFEEITQEQASTSRVHQQSFQYGCDFVETDSTTLSPSFLVHDAFLSSTDDPRTASNSSWSSRLSPSCTMTNSSGYSSAFTCSCPSSANSHRSHSPPPDFSQTKLELLTEDCCVNDCCLSEEAFDTSPLQIRKASTWPPYHCRPRQTTFAERRSSSAEDCLTQSNALYGLNSEDGVKSIENIKKSLKEWTIPFSDLQFGEIVGSGPKGSIYRGKWHGDIMIHTRRESSREEIENFWREISLLSMIRHENVVLFMGACLDPPHLAVITSVHKGHSLHTHLHIRQYLFPMATRINISRQIAQGMGYIHAKGIILSNVNSRCIFLESRVKLCITDYASGHMLPSYRDGYAHVPKGHLTYAAPELIRTLHVGQKGTLWTETNFTTYSDIYAYGTLLFEIMSCRWPYADETPETIIWKVGKGMHESLSHIKATDNIRELVRECWLLDPVLRPTVTDILKVLQQQNVTFSSCLTPRRRKHSYSDPERINMVGNSFCRPVKIRL